MLRRDFPVHAFIFLHAHKQCQNAVMKYLQNKEDDIADGEFLFPEVTTRKNLESITFEGSNHVGSKKNVIT